jgi:hypothetical protein
MDICYLGCAADLGVSGTGYRPRLAAFGGLLGHIGAAAKPSPKDTSCCFASRY